jgi:hypothetical protein
MNFNERILKYIEFKGLNKTDFYIKCGLPNGFLDKSPNKSLDNILKIIQAFPELNIEWLITGKGDMLKKTSPESEQIKDLQEKIYLYEKTISAQEETIRLLKKQLEECERNQKNSASVSKTSLKLK